MNVLQLMKDTIAVYQRHGWELRRVLLRSETRPELSELGNALAGAQLVDSDLNAVWFARPSHSNREAWELRLIAEPPYALFEAFEAEESEEDRETARQEMENRMREYART